MAGNQVYEPGNKLSVVCSAPATIVSGAPVRYGAITGVALTDKGAGGNAATYTTVDFGPGVWQVTVDDNEDSAIAVGAAIYFHDSGTGTGAVNLNNSASAADALFGYALEAVTTSATTSIKVKHVEWALSNIGSGAVTATQIGSGAVTAVKIAANVIDDSKLALTTAGNVLGTIPVIFRFHHGVGASDDQTITVTHKVLIIDAWLVLESTGVGSEVVTLKNVSTGALAALAASGADGTVVRAVTWVTAQRTVTAGTALVSSAGGGASQPSMTLFVMAMPTA